MIRKCVLGCDWSSCQGVVNVANVVRQSAHNPHPIRYAIQKATDGLGEHPDPQFVRTFSAMRAAGLKWRGVYHWLRPRFRGDMQAKLCAKIILDAGYDRLTDLPVYVDWEITDGLSGAALSAPMFDFAEALSELLRKDVGVYTGKWFTRENHVPDDPRFAKMHLWHAQYPSGNRDGVEYEKAIADLTNPDLPDPYKSRGLAETFWQFDGGDGGAHKGLTLPGGVDSDFDLFNGDEDELQRYVDESVWPDVEATPVIQHEPLMPDIGWRPESRDAVLAHMFPDYVAPVTP